MKLLFVCTENLNRSPTAAELFKKNKKHKAKSAGISITAENNVSNELIKWADKIFVMEKVHKKFITDKVPDAENKIEVLWVPDVYPKNDPKLIEILKKKLKNYLKNNK
ncbi:phosphotyrosine protein phosphatase [Candidatus Pacearchaeota archaeon]|nr:phosphotyrosine protein phosphatase [Candidatus Pacearchaeota archaeon]MBD3283768.1 phosphotyrosine protein phosphatase [Candidatus Pacearchaeota archaeon]